MRLTQRLLLGSLGVIGVFVASIMLVVDLRLREGLLAEARRELEREARVVAALWSTDADPELVARDAARALQHRVTLLLPNGRALGDSELELSQLAGDGDFRQLPEVSVALRDSVGWDVGRMPDGQEELRVAVLSPQGIVRVTYDLSDVGAAFDNARRGLVVAGIVAMGLAAVIAWLFARAVVRPVVELARRRAEPRRRGPHAAALARRAGRGRRPGERAAPARRAARRPRRRAEGRGIAARRAQRGAERGRGGGGPAAAGGAHKRDRASPAADARPGALPRRPPAARAGAARRARRGAARRCHRRRRGDHRRTHADPRRAPAPRGRRGARALRPDADPQAGGGAARLRGERVARAAHAADDRRRFRRDAGRGGRAGGAAAAVRREDPLQRAAHAADRRRPARPVAHRVGGLGAAAGAAERPRHRRRGRRRGHPGRLAQGDPPHGGRRRTAPRPSTRTRPRCGRSWGTSSTTPCVTRRATARCASSPSRARAASWWA